MHKFRIIGTEIKKTKGRTHFSSSLDFSKQSLHTIASLFHRLSLTALSKRTNDNSNRRRQEATAKISGFFLFLLLQKPQQKVNKPWASTIGRSHQGLPRWRQCSCYYSCQWSPPRNSSALQPPEGPGTTGNPLRRCRRSRSGYRLSTLTCRAKEGSRMPRILSTTGEGGLGRVQQGFC